MEKVWDTPFASKRLQCAIKKCWSCSISTDTHIIIRENSAENCCSFFALDFMFFEWKTAVSVDTADVRWGQKQKRLHLMMSLHGRPLKKRKKKQELKENYVC